MRRVILNWGCWGGHADGREAIADGSSGKATPGSEARGANGLAPGLRFS